MSPIYVQCDNIYHKGSRILVFRVWPWYSTWEIWERQSCTKKNRRFKVARCVESYTVFLERSIWNYGLVVKAGHNESGNMVWFLQGAEPLQPFDQWLPFCVALSPSVHRKALFYTAALCALFFFFFVFVSGYRTLTGFSLLRWTAEFHCFQALGVGPGACLTTCAGLAHGRNYSYCRASDNICLAMVFPWRPWYFLVLSKILENNGPLWRLFNPYRPDVLGAPSSCILWRVRLHWVCQGFCRCIIIALQCGCIPSSSATREQRWTNQIFPSNWLDFSHSNFKAIFEG